MSQLRGGCGWTSRSRMLWLLCAAFLSLDAADALPVAGRRLLQSNSTAAAPAATTTREYWIAAETVQWEYAPADVNLCYGRNYTDTEASYVTAGFGNTFLKAQYVGYTDGTFSEKTVRPASEEHLGLLGPLIRAVAGDTIVVHLLNRLTFPVNLLASGLNTSAVGTDQVAGPTQTVTWTWSVPLDAAPGSDEDASSKLWLYRSVLTQQTDANSGLVGPIIVTAPDAAAADGSPSDVDVEFVTLFQVFDESNSPFTSANQAMFAANAPNGGLSSDDFSTVLLKHAINGKLYCSLSGLNAAVGDRVRWHIATLGNEVDVHSAHFHGHTLAENGRNVDSFKLIPSVVRTTTFVPDNPGVWLYHCHVNSHQADGMMALYNITGEQPAYPLNGTVRTYYIQAEEHMWDYAPDNGESCSGSVEPFGDNALVAVTANSTRIGRTYIKALFVEYTDATFQTKKVRSAAEEHLGLLGPTIRAEVGDEIRVVFSNRMRYPASVHSHGVLYNKSSEGSPYDDGTSGTDKGDDSVPANEQWTYVWKVPDRAGPGPRDPSSVMWMYHSHTAEAADGYAGLMGAIVISRKGVLQPSGLPEGIDREFVLFFSVMDEGSSLFLSRNMANFLPALAGGTTVIEQTSTDEALGGAAVSFSSPSAEVQALLDDQDFQASNMMYGINGRIFCNLKGLSAVQGDNVRFYIMALGDEVDLHTAGAVSTTFSLDQQNSDIISVMPGVMDTGDSLQSQPGQYVLRCHTAAHTDGGMQAMYTVNASAAATAAALQGSSEDTAGSGLISTLAFLSQALSGIFLGIGGGTAANRQYFVQAEQVTWDYAPQGQYMCNEVPRPFADAETLYTEVASNTLGPRMLKALYRGYTDATFGTQVVEPVQHGLLGPFIRAQVGDVIDIVFRNSLPNAVNFVFNGGLIPDDPSYLTAAISPGQTVTQRWTVPAAAGPGALDLSTVAHSYGSTVNPINDFYSGLFGLSMIAAKGALLPSGLVEGVDLIMPLLFVVWDEAQSPYFNDNIAASSNPLVALDDPNFVEGNLKHSINGFMFCNMPPIEVQQGQAVRWLTVGMGTENDLHTPIFINQVVMEQGQVLDGALLLPAVSHTIDTQPGDTGLYLFQCDVQDHNIAGMKARINVTASA